MSRFSIAAVLFATLIGCSTKHASPTVTQNPLPVETTAPTVAPTPAPTVETKPTLEVQVTSVGNQMAFNVKEIKVSAGQPVHLVFKNTSTMTTMAHNWVLVKPGTEASVAARGLKMGETAGYIDVTDHNMLAHTPMAKAGETTEVSFTAPDEPGTYPFVCSFPGHYLFMKGALIVQ